VGPPLVGRRDARVRPCHGAKQLLPAFLVGLVIGTLWDQVRNKRYGTILLGLLGGGAAILTWFIPLSLHVGTVKACVDMALSQLAYQRAHEALVFDLVPSRIYSQLQATFVLIRGSKGLALPMWSFVAVGAWQVLTRHVPLRWLLWLVSPTVFVRFFSLGYSPRFTLYYLPFLMPLQELRGPIPIYSGWHGKEFESGHAARWSKAEGSQIRLIRPALPGAPSACKGSFPHRISGYTRHPLPLGSIGEPVYTGWQEQIDISFHVQLTETMGNRQWLISCLGVHLSPPS
jgi:hypothetical protein